MTHHFGNHCITCLQDCEKSETCFNFLLWFYSRGARWGENPKCIWLSFGQWPWLQVTHNLCVLCAFLGLIEVQPLLFSCLAALFEHSATSLPPSPPFFFYLSWICFFLQGKKKKSDSSKACSAEHTQADESSDGNQPDTELSELEKVGIYPWGLAGKGKRKWNKTKSFEWLQASAVPRFKSETGINLENTDPCKKIHTSLWLWSASVSFFSHFLDFSWGIWPICSS